jgi:predicted metal-binding membrane protein
LVRDDAVGAELSASEVRGVTGRSDIWLPVALLILAGLGWWWSAVSAGDMAGDAVPMDGMPMDGMPMEPQPAMAMSFVAFLVAWVAMMAAMMFPAVLPVVRLYARAAANGQAAPVAVFVGGYIVLWAVVGIPAFFAWSRLNEPLMQGSPWAGRVAGAVAVAAGLYQLTPLKSVCLRHCRSPLSFFMRHGKHLDRPTGAFVAGVRHGMFCVGCCWMLMALLIAFGAMQLAWMLVLAVLILLEKIASFGEQLARVTGAALLVLGVALLVRPDFVTHLV